MIAFINASLIDGTGAPARKNAKVVINGSRIESVGADAFVPDNAVVIDLGGKTLLPAFSDAHTHYGGSDLLTRVGLGGRDTTYDYALCGNNSLEWGVTTVRSAGDFMPDIVTYRDEVNVKGLHAPRILTAGRMFMAPGGHPIGTVFFSNESIRDNACILCDESTDIDAEVKALADAGVDWIKAFISTMNKMNYPHTVPRLPHETLRRITEAAHKNGKPVMLHVENPTDMQEAADLGVESIEHVINVGNTDFDIPDSLLNDLCKRGIYVIPTISSIKAHDGSIEGAVPVYAHAERAVKLLADAGVKLAIGCDSCIPFVPIGESVHIELELFVSAGLAPLDVLRIAAKGNAELFGMSDTLGAIEAGKLADLVVLNADPLEDIRNTRQIALVMKEGRVVTDKLLSK